MRWRWLGWLRHPANGAAAKLAAELAARDLEQAKRLTPRVDRTAEHGQEMATRGDWFTRDMERAFRFRGQL